jgi:CHAT domain-containing protein
MPAAPSEESLLPPESVLNGASGHVQELMRGGRLDEAIALTEKLLVFCEQNLATKSPLTAKVRRRLEELRAQRGDERAKKSREAAAAQRERDLAGLRRALATIEEQFAIKEKSLSPNHPELTDTLSQLAGLLASAGDLPKALALSDRALRIAEANYDSDSPRLVATLNSAANLQGQAGNFSAELALRRKMIAAQMRLTPRAPANLAEAEAVGRNIQNRMIEGHGNERPNNSRLFISKAMSALALGDKAVAHAAALDAEKSDADFLEKVLLFGTEQDRLTYQSSAVLILPLFATLGSAPDIARFVLRRKGVILDSLIEDRALLEAASDAESAAIAGRLEQAKQRMAQTSLARLGTGSDRPNPATEDLRREIDELETALAKRVVSLGGARRALSVTVEQAQATLPKDAALIEFVSFVKLDPQTFLRGGSPIQSFYGAIILAATGVPKWVVLGPVQEVQKSIEQYQLSVRGKTDVLTLRNSLRGLHDLLWAPLVPELSPSTRELILCPEGALNFISFATLLDPADEFVAAKYSLRYVASGRDLLRPPKTAGAREAVVMGNPLFTEQPGPAAADRGGFVADELEGLLNLSLPPLPASGDEAANVAAQCEKAGCHAVMLTGKNASEAALRAVDSPYVLHLATHGFFLASKAPLARSKPTPGAPLPTIGGLLQNSMRRGGLAMAGAKVAQEQWRAGRAQSTVNDGILTAEEVGFLRLSKTWLVTLSACDTGSGAPYPGEGVLGLRRGFIQAGAQNLLMTLWPISDETTVQIMLDFYQRAFATGNAPRALADVQRDWLVRLRNELGLREAVRLAGPFIMSSQGTGK